MKRRNQVRTAVSHTSSTTSEAATLVHRGLILSLAWTRAQLALMRPEDFEDPDTFRAVLTRRHKAVRRTERLLSVLWGTAW